MISPLEFYERLIAPGNMEQLCKEYELEVFNNPEEIEPDVSVPLWKQATDWMGRKNLQYENMERIRILLHNLPEDWDRARSLLHPELFI